MAERLALQRAAEVLDCAAKYAFHSKHAALTVADLRLAGGASRHGDAAAPLPQLLRVPDAADLLCRAETETLISEAVHAAHLPSVPFEVGVAPHWLATDGTQPITVENAQPRSVTAPSRTLSGTAATAARRRPATTATGGSGGAVSQNEEAGAIPASLPLKHSMPEELQLYFDVVRQALQSKAGLPGKGPLGPRAVAASLATDPGLQPMLPYLAPLLADEVGKNLGDAGQLHSVLSATRGLLSNASLHLLPYIHHLLPAIMTCLVARHIGTGDEHWAIRDKAAALVPLVAQQSQQHNDALAAALARMQRALAASLFADAPSTQYGSLVGLTAFGVPLLMETLLPVLQGYAPLFQEEEQTSASLHVRAALMVAFGRCMSWGGGTHAAGIMLSVPDAAFRAALRAVSPSSYVHL